MRTGGIFSPSNMYKIFPICHLIWIVTQMEEGKQGENKVGRNRGSGGIAASWTTKCSFSLWETFITNSVQNTPSSYFKKWKKKKKGACIRIPTQAKSWLPWSTEHSQFPFTAAALGDTNTWKSQIYVLLNRSPYALKSMIQQESWVLPIPKHRRLHLICILRLQIILLVFKPWCQRAGCSIFQSSFPILNVWKSCRVKTGFTPSRFRAREFQQFGEIL